MTCGGLCPGINTVIREIVCSLKNMYGVDDVLGIQVSMMGTQLLCFHSKYKMVSLLVIRLQEKRKKQR